MTDICSDIESIGRVVRAAGWRRIGIDGVDGAGKSYLAEWLCQELECPNLDVDDYLHKNQGGYIDFIDYPALAAALASMPAFVLSGACLREVLANLGTSLDGNIYIKRVRDGLWLDEDACVFPDGVDAAIETLGRHNAMMSQYFDEPHELALSMGNDDEPRFVEEVMRYHDAYSPQEEADLVFERGEHA
jgi:hypothetical protein